VSYAHGVVDPIRELGAIARERGVWLHVDACMGGFLLPYFRRLGAPVPDFELDVPGVSSISMDFHKYAFAAKGASVVLYKSADLRQYQLYACSNWTGYTVINATVQSTKSVGPLAAAWAVLQHFGDEGYLALARRVLDCTRRIAEEVERIPGLRLLGKPEMNLVAFTSDGPSVFHVVDEMKQRGWYVQPQLGYGPSRENIHLSIMPSNVKWTEPFLADLRASVEAARALPSGALKAEVERAFGDVDPASVSDETIAGLLALAGADGDDLPERLADVNETLNALPWRLRERLLVAYLNQLYRQPRAPGA
jgi:sphinganine-1-phosphate aldolase